MKNLIVIDMQKDFVNGSLGSEAAQSIVPGVEKKLSEGGYDRVIFTFDTHFDNYSDTLEGKKLPVPHCIKGTDGWETSLDKRLLTGHELIEKNTFGYVGWKEKLGELGSGDSIDVVGLCTDICVVSNALLLRAAYPDVPITVDASCCAGTSDEAHKAALTVMKSCQIDVVNE